MRAIKSLATLAMLGFFTFAAAVAEDAIKPKPSATPTIDPQKLANLKRGMSRSQVKSLLGEPWRTVQYNDLDQVKNEFWEYRGKDSEGTFRLHIEFDRQGAVVIIGKIPDRVPGGKATPAKK
jgi:outer membrane protein assembly factor BamE (lipoprotein component of BamABCDE complex)